MSDQSNSSKDERSEQAHISFRVTGPRIAFLAIGLLLLGISLQGASASTLGDISVKLLGTATASTNCPGTIGITPTYAYRASPNQYEINNIALTNVGTNCQGQRYSLTFAQGDSTGTAINTDTGTLNNAQGATPSFSVTAADRPNLDSVNITNNQMKYVLFIGDN